VLEEKPRQKLQLNQTRKTTIKRQT